LTDDGHPNKAMYLSHLGLSQLVRFKRLGELTDIEDSISNQYTALQLTKDGHPNKPIRLSNLGLAQRTRFDHSGELTDLENSISNLYKAGQLTDDRYPEKAVCLSNLSASQHTRFECLGEWTDIENCILNLEKAVQLTYDRNPDKASYLSNLGACQLTCYECFGELTEVKHSISNLRKAVHFTDDEDIYKTRYLANLSNSHGAHFKRLCEPTDLGASISSLKLVAQSKTAFPCDALHAARDWADLSYHHQDASSALDGYCTALEMLPKVAWLGLSTASCLSSLSQEDSEHLSCLAATCAIWQGRLEKSVELLDLGRSVFWQQVLSLQVELEELKEMELELADQLEKVGQKLDFNNFSGWLSHPEKHNAGANSTEDISKERCCLVGKWEGLLERVRQLLNFEHFLRPVPFHELCQAATGGHVIIINISWYGVDALIFDDTHQIEWSNHIERVNHWTTCLSVCLPYSSWSAGTTWRGNASCGRSSICWVSQCYCHNVGCQQQRYSNCG
jgi:hypothetical protein